MLELDVRRVIEQVSRDRGIDREVLIKTLEEALKSAARKKFGTKVEIEVRYNEELGEVEVFQFKDVVQDVTEPDLQMSLEEGRKLDPECEEGDSLGAKMDATAFGRIAAQSAKQVIIQKMKDAERDVVYEGFIDRKGEIINGIVQRMDRGDIMVNLGRTEATLPSQEQVPRETYYRGDRIRAYVVDVLRETRGPQIILSRTHPQFLVTLFKTEVPEIAEGIVNIMAAAREPGIRAKISVASNDSDIDPVGACVGMKGSRVQSVVQELKGEKIDIIPWHSDPAKFVCNALAPAEISRVVMDEIKQSMEVIVPDEHLAVAIGKRGQNVRLASKLTGWSIDIKSESQYSHAMRAGYESLLDLPGMGASTADALYEHGFYSVEELANASVDELIQIKGIGQIKARALLESAQQALEDTEESGYAGEDGELAHVAGGKDSSEGVSEEAEAPDQTTVPTEGS
jgi:N utilization substance protein A